MGTILIAEDSPELMTVLRRAAAGAGHRVLEARNGREAISTLLADQIDLLVLDLVMPEMDGLEALDQLREAKTGFKVLAMSGGGRVGADDYLKIARLLGADRTLAKPFTIQVFLAQIGELLTPPLAT